MWLVLAESTDTAAGWAAVELRRRGLDPLELVTSEQLGTAVRWEHRLGGGRPRVDIALADGRRILGESVRGSLNRLFAVSPAAMSNLEAADRQYAQGELYALYASWLHALPGPMLNAPGPLGLAGRWRTEFEWAALASRAGLRIEPRLFGHDDDGEGEGTPPRMPLPTAIVVAGRVIGPPLPDDVRAACGRLAALADAELLGIELKLRQDRDSTFAGATPWPDLRAGGEPLLDALAEALREPSRRLAAPGRGDESGGNSGSAR
jgi:hypothetical protein